MGCPWAFPLAPSVSCPDAFFVTLLSFVCDIPLSFKGLDAPFASFVLAGH